MSIRFRFNPQKAVEVILWFADRQPGITFHALFKMLFYAERRHLNRHGRPIVGDDYVAMQYGPVPSTMYDMLKGDALALELVREPAFVVKDGYHVHGRRAPNLDLLSESDVEVLDWAYGKYGHLNFGLLTELTHSEPAWVNADGRRMRYEDFLDDTPDKADRVKSIAEAAPRMVL